MKRIVTAVLLMLALSVGCFCSNRYIVRTSAALQGKTDAVYSALQSSSFPEAHRAMADSYALWQQCRAPLSAIVRTSAALQGKTDAVYSALQSSSFPEAHRAMADSYALWQQCRAPLSAIVRHNELDEIDRLYQRAQQALDNADKNESLLQLRELRGMLRLLPDMEKPTYANLL